MDPIPRTEWQRQLSAACDPQLLFSSRIHRLPSFERPGVRVYAKREDESSFGMSGFKRRKYASLLPYLREQGIRQVLLIGGSQSNHIIGITQLLREGGFGLHALLKQGHATASHGNGLLRRLLLHESEITWVSSSDWPRVEHLAAAMAQRAEVPSMVLPEGGSCAAAVPGAASLFEDLLRNEQALGKSFDHVVVDAGTAMMAACLALLMGHARHPGSLHVVSMAEEAPFIHQQIARVARWLEPWLGLCLQPIPKLQVHRPPTARAFGSVNRRVLEACLRLARAEGMLVDPVYSGKLFLTAEHLLEQGTLSGDVLLIHSGGGTGLMGFGEKLAALT